ncbi:MAG: polymer-forming cytoskeletal protein [Treponema sp.]|jgi:cytoskeletal protein CcmA (bactofilin family)|nr:polymer-forming cytoskeletal protein [Treponema sp.]
MSKEFVLNTIIGDGSSIVGDVETRGFTRVDGSVRGNLRSKGRIVISEKARMKSDVSGTTITIGGVVYGNVIASERLIVLASGLVMGDIITRRIQADDGCLIHGKIAVCSTAEEWDTTIAKYQDVKDVRLTLSSSKESKKWKK